MLDALHVKRDGFWNVGGKYGLEFQMTVLRGYFKKRQAIFENAGDVSGLW